MKRLLVSCFGLGWLPGAPGTWGSVPPMLIFALIGHFSTSTMITSIIMAALAVAASVVCVKFAPAVINATGKTDPREVVVDEFAGQAVAFIPIAVLPISRVCTIAVLGFLFFRLFDITKPWPIRRLERLPKGWSILADDLLAGVYAGIVLLFCHRIGLVEYLSGLPLCSKVSSINVFSAVILGAVQGLTEFLPVSSSGHLVLFETLFNFDPEKPGMLLFDLAVHVGTVATIFIVFRKSIAAFFKNLMMSGRYGTAAGKMGSRFAGESASQKIVKGRLSYCKMALRIYKKSPSVHFLVLAIVATGVTGILGVLFKDYFTSARGNLATVALMWVLTGTLLLITDLRKKTRLGLRQFGIIAAVLVGVSQAIAIMPGISRSGATICTAILIGLHRRWAVEFSFLIAIPAILGATAIQLVENFAEIGSGGLPISSVLIGPVTAALVGILALKLLIRASRAANLKVFAFYCYILACFVLIYYLK
jgi:undecaprenyl-diphosphatase